MELGSSCSFRVLASKFATAAAFGTSIFGHGLHGPSGYARDVGEDVRTQAGSSNATPTLASKLPIDQILAAAPSMLDTREGENPSHTSLGIGCGALLP